jgi:hypothetical protein
MLARDVEGGGHVVFCMSVKGIERCAWLLGTR